MDRKKRPKWNTTAVMGSPTTSDVRGTGTMDEQTATGKLDVDGRKGKSGWYTPVHGIRRLHGLLV